jgi:hypothetical protein
MISGAAGPRGCSDAVSPRRSEGGRAMGLRAAAASAPRVVHGRARLLIRERRSTKLVERLARRPSSTSAVAIAYAGGGSRPSPSRSPLGAGSRGRELSRSGRHETQRDGDPSIRPAEHQDPGARLNEPKRSGYRVGERESDLQRTSLFRGTRQPHLARRQKKSCRSTPPAARRPLTSLPVGPR